jgi:hypothetical protein
MLGTHPLQPVLPGDDPEDGELVGDAPVAEGRVVVMDIQGGIDKVGVVPVPDTERVDPPLVERLLGETEHPTSHHDGNPVSGRVQDQRVHHFVRASQAKNAAARRRDLTLLLEDPVALLQLPDLGRLGRRDPGTDTILDVSQVHPPMQTRLRDPEVLGDLADGRLALRTTATTSRRNSLGKGFGHRDILPARTESSHRRSQPDQGQTRPP